jgi:hypothetical protein
MPSYQAGGSGTLPTPTFTVYSPRDPSTNDKVDQNGSSYRAGQSWINSQTSAMFIYFTGGKWVEVADSMGDILSLTDNAGTFVYPNPTGNIQLAAGAGITTTAGSNTITIAATGMGFSWQVVTSVAPANPITLQPETGYFCNGGATVNFVLPALAAVGDTYVVANTNTSTGWIITQKAGQNIIFGSLTTTTGVAHGISSSANGDTVHLVCYVANTTWQSVDAFGNITLF